MTYTEVVREDQCDAHFVQVLGVFNLNKSTNYRNNLGEYRFQLDHFVGGDARRGQHRLSAFGVTSLKPP
ncbi:hypothetical protein QIS74_06839 [Colletotrichum tabaci]|uniref:Uncharacterized protein n=1 Tax=Colletotrichum tabaci TaxID=1209068 RepID=A0AAV9T9H2_9PEZI